MKRILQALLVLAFLGGCCTSDSSFSDPSKTCRGPYNGFCEFHGKSHP